MSYPAVRRAETIDHAVAIAGALTFGVRTSRFYAAEHPAVTLAVERIVSVATEATARGPLVLAVTPQTLLVGGAPIDGIPVVADCARLLHAADILQLSLLHEPPPKTVRTLLGILVLEYRERRARGGPATIWNAEGDSSFAVDQFDYQNLLEREASSSGTRHDALWQTIVRSVVARQRTFSENEQHRLLEISRDARAIGELVDECRSAYYTADGSPLLTMQASAVLSVYRHIRTTVGVLEPERQSEVVRNFASATSALEPALAMALLRSSDPADDQQALLGALKQALDEQQVAMLVARALAAGGTANNHLTDMLDTLAPDPDRRARVLRIADKLLLTHDFGSQQPLNDLRRTLQELFVRADNEKSGAVAAASTETSGAAARAAQLSAPELPREMEEWRATMRPESVRELSGQLLIDLLHLETDEHRATDVVRDMSAFAEDSILAGAYRDTTRIVRVLSSANSPSSAARLACRSALTGLAESMAMREAMALLGELSASDVDALLEVCVAIGPAVVPAVLSGFIREDGGRERERARKILVALGPPAIAGIAAALENASWWLQRDLATTLGVIGSPDAVPPLQHLLRRGDERVLAAVVPALGNITDPSASRALGTVLRAASGQARTTVVASLVTARDARVLPMLTRILDESESLGKDFELVLQTLDAVATFTDDRAIKSVVSIARQYRWLAPRRSLAMRQRAIATLARIGTPAAVSSLARLATTGDRQIRKLAAAARSSVRQR